MLRDVGAVRMAKTPKVSPLSNPGFERSEYPGVLPPTSAPRRVCPNN